MRIKLLIGKPDFYIEQDYFRNKILIPKWRLFGELQEVENCFNKIVGYKKTRRWVSICVLFVGLKIYY